jgi:A/G-specific adenine glycosylase
MAVENALNKYAPVKPLRQLAPHLLGWYDKVHTNRDMPWRQTTDPYAIWLSETMLQQTQVATVKPYFRRFLERFPTVADLAAADLDSVLALWAGLGYYRRARHLHAAARAMVDRHGGRVPTTVEELLALPGIGRYTAGAVASIAFGVAAPVVDGNVMRVLARLTGFDKNIADPKNAAFFWTGAAEVIAGAAAGTGGGKTREGRYGDVNQAIMELGATVCVPPPAAPACLLCPARAFCRAFAEGRQLELPVKAKKKAVPEVRGVAVVVVRTRTAADGGPQREVLLVRRPAGVVWEHMWEFPVVARDGEREEGTGDFAQLAREVTGLPVNGARLCGEAVHTLTHRRMVYQVVRAETTDGEKPRLPACPEGGTYVEARWVAWPLAGTPAVAMGRVVGKIAQVAG